MKVTTSGVDLAFTIPQTDIILSSVCLISDLREYHQPACGTADIWQDTNDDDKISKGNMEETLQMAKWTHQQTALWS